MEPDDEEFKLELAHLAERAANLLKAAEEQERKLARREPAA